MKMRIFECSVYGSDGKGAKKGAFHSRNWIGVAFDCRCEDDNPEPPNPNDPPQHGVSHAHLYTGIDKPAEMQRSPAIRSTPFLMRMMERKRVPGELKLSVLLDDEAGKLEGALAQGEANFLADDEHLEMLYQEYVYSGA